LADPLLAVTNGAPGLIRAVETCFPRAVRQRCLVHRLRNLRSKAPESQWPEIAIRARACYEAASPALARLLRDDFVQVYGRELLAFVQCFTDDFDACIAHLRFPLRHRKVTRTTTISSSDSSLPALLGPEAAGLSSSAILRLTKAWPAEYEAFRRRDLADRDYIYLWADGVHFTIRLEEERLCTRVVIGVRPDGTKEVVALEDGSRESAESWRTLLRNLKHRGRRAPVLAIGDGALGFWAAVRAVWPETAEQRCWVHRIANVLDKLPRSLQPRAKQALHEIMYAATRAAAERELARFPQAYGPKYPKAVASLTVDQPRLLASFDYPAAHWKHLRTTNPIESTFATVRLREGVTKGAGSRTAGLVMTFKLLQVAEGHWRRLDAAELVSLVRAGVGFEDGVQIEPQKTRKKAAA